VLTGHQRRTDAFQRYGSRPPRAEHVRVDQIGAGQTGAQPIDERIIWRPLQPPVLPGGECLDCHAVAAGHANARPGGVPGQQQRRVDPETGQGPREPQRGQLGATRFQDADDPNNAHHRSGPSRCIGTIVPESDHLLPTHRSPVAAPLVGRVPSPSGPAPIPTPSVGSTTAWQATTTCGGLLA
jgi:hypothetical protein